MTKQLIRIAAVASALNGTFFRLGRAFTTEGVIVEPETFTEDEWAVLQSTSMLHISPAPEGAEVEMAAQATVADAVKAAIGALEPAGFDKDGAPTVAALRDALPDLSKKITAKLVAEVWSELKPAP